MRHIFIDESGIHKKDGVSTVVLVYVCVDALKTLDRAVLGAESDLGIEAFHWSHSAWDVRTEFIKAISGCDFTITIVFIRNPFHEYAAYSYVLGLLSGERDIRSIIIDGKKSKAYEGKVKKILRDKRIPVRNLKMANDDGFPALRVADACAGIARYHYENPADRRIIDLYWLISRKITGIFEE